MPLKFNHPKLTGITHIEETMLTSSRQFQGTILTSSHATHSGSRI